MTNAGWYPDPAGAPDTYRYWDGQAWSQMTTSTPPGGSAPQQPQQQAPQPPQQPGPPSYPQAPQQPYGAVPPVAPPPAGGYGQPQWSPSPQPGGGGGSGKTVGIVIAAVLVLLLIGVGGFFGVRALTGDDDDTKADDSTSESADQSEGTDGTDSTDGPTDGSSSTVAPTGVQCTGGKPDPATNPGANPATITGGGLTIPVAKGYQVDARLSKSHAFAEQILVQYKLVEKSWISEFAVGGLLKSNGFEDLADTAEIIMQCLTSSDQIYEGFTSRKDLKNEDITVGGKPAHRITAEIRVDNPDVQAEGDVTTVAVVDTGDPDELGLFIGVGTIGDPVTIDLSEQMLRSVKVG